jgi:hypothetical protein
LRCIAPSKHSRVKIINIHRHRNFVDLLNYLFGFVRSIDNLSINIERLFGFVKLSMSIEVYDQMHLFLINSILYYTEWPKSHVTEKQSNISVSDSIKRADIFTINKGMFTPHIHKDKARENPFFNYHYWVQ